MMHTGKEGFCWIVDDYTGFKRACPTMVEDVVEYEQKELRSLLLNLRRPEWSSWSLLMGEGTKTTLRERTSQMMREMTWKVLSGMKETTSGKTRDTTPTAGYRRVICATTSRCSRRRDAWRQEDRKREKESAPRSQ
jgi:hypothetical protein